MRQVKSAPTREFGKTPVHYDTESLLFKGMPQEAICWMSHVDYVSRLPEGFTAICHTAATANAGIQCKEKNLYGVQFHPEFKSRPNRAHPLFKGFIAAALRYRAAAQRDMLHL